jgi:hypothetical protein
VQAATDELPSLIRALSDSDAAVRARVATDIFQRGCDIARNAVQSWLADADLAGCFFLDASGFPAATVGVAVEPHTFEIIRRACGFPPLANVPADLGAQEFELEFPGGVRLDILTTGQPGGPGAMARHLRKFGESIQQVELLAKNVDAASAVLQARFGIAPLFSATRAGANDTRVNFFLVPASQGKKVLIELVEARTAA